MPIDRRSVESVARLARIKVDQDTLDRLSLELSAILTFVEQLGEVDTSAAEPDVVTVRLRRHVEDCGLEPALEPARSLHRADVVGETGAEGILRNAPMVVSGFFAVPKVIE